MTRRGCASDIAPLGRANNAGGFAPAAGWANLAGQATARAEAQAMAADWAFYHRTFVPGATIYEKGETRDVAYYILSGEVEIFDLDGRGHERPLARLGPGELFGEMAFIDHGQRSAYARAVNETTCAIITSQRINKTLQKSDPALHALLRTLVERLRQANQAHVAASESSQRNAVSDDF